MIFYSAELIELFVPDDFYSFKLTVELTNYDRLPASEIKRIVENIMVDYQENNSRLINHNIRVNLINFGILLS